MISKSSLILGRKRSHQANGMDDIVVSLVILDGMAWHCMRSDQVSSDRRPGIFSAGIEPIR